MSRKKSSSSSGKSEYSGASHLRDSTTGKSRTYSRSEVSHLASSSDGTAGGYSRSVSGATYGKMHKKRKRRKHIAVAVVVLVCALVLGGGAAALGWVGMVNSQLKAGLDDIDSVLVSTSSSSDPYYILLMGTDGRDDDEAERTDTIILVRVDASNNQVVLISIPRDTRIYLDGYGYVKINAAHAYSGASGAVEAVSEFAGVEISHYAEVDFEGFVDLVDALGGVEVDVPIDIDDPDAGGSLSAGLQVLDGEQALIFCRSRDTSIGDYQRQTNQRIFLQALASEVLDSDSATMLSAVNAISEAVTTDMSVQTIMNMASELSGLTTDNIYSYTVPSYTETIDGVSYVIAYEDEWAEMMATIDSGGLPDDQDDSLTGVTSEEYENAETDSDEDSDEESESEESTATVTPSDYAVTIRNGGGIEGAASEASSTLSSAGYQIESTGNADQYVYDQTLVIYDADEDEAVAEAIVDTLGVGEVVQSAGRYSFDGDLLVVVGADWTQ